GHLIVIPKVAQERLPNGYADEAREQGAAVIENIASREKIVAESLAALTKSNAQDGIELGNSQLASDFLALGFCRLQGELLTRRMRYSSHLDEAKFEQA